MHRRRFERLPQVFEAVFEFGNLLLHFGARGLVGFGQETVAADGKEGGHGFRLFRVEGRGGDRRDAGTTGAADTDMTFLSDNNHDEDKLPAK